ncbi:MAG: hypothetical protein QRY74_00525 [Chlamydia sp.]
MIQLTMNMKGKMMQKFSLVLLGLIFSSCTSNQSIFSSWQISKTLSEKEPQFAIAIPYANGDETGELTNRIIYAIQSLPNTVIDDTASQMLIISILDAKEQKIGYRQDPDTSKKIIPNENRSKMLISVSLIERDSKKEIWKTGYILGSIDYDHQNSTINGKNLTKSLGQLADIDTAREVAYIPLYRDISKKVAFWVHHQREIEHINQ